MIFVKIFILQLFWFFVVSLGHSFPQVLFFIISTVILVGDYLIFRPLITPGRLMFVVVVFLLIGFLNDYAMIMFNFISKESYHVSALSLWIVFPLYYERFFKKFYETPWALVSLIGAVGGSLTYVSAVKLGGLHLNTGKEISFFIYQFFFWGVFFPWSMSMYFKNDYWDKLLDITVLFSFDHSGYLRHQKKFTENLINEKINSKNILVTGGTSGIGESVSVSLGLLGGGVFFTGRNVKKGIELENQIANSKFVSLDMANWNDVFEFAKNSPEFDYLVLNAGGMPNELHKNKYGIESQCASQLLGHYFLLVWLNEFKKLKAGARIIWVSSGGMYLKKLDLNLLFENNNYEKVGTYANVKRAQVTLIEEMAKEQEWSNYFISSMHPGWVKTEGVKEALPRFYHLLKNRLRTPAEGADTILWYLLTKSKIVPGAFYFDREKVSPYISKKFIPSDLERKKLLQRIQLELASFKQSI